LAFASHFQLFSLSAVLLPLSDLFASSLTFLLLKRTFSSQCIDLRLAISSFFLHFAQTGNFPFLFFLQATFLQSLSDFSGNFLLVVTDDVLLLVELLLVHFLLLGQSDLVCSLDLSNQAQVAFTFLLSSLDLS
jgi:hypothetical protein